MPPAIPFLLANAGAISAGSAVVGAGAAVKGARDARKGQKEQLMQADRLAEETRANTAQNERSATDMFARRRARRSPGFSDAGAATVGAYGGNAALGA
jgi:hypothetical protein